MTKKEKKDKDLLGEFLKTACQVWIAGLFVKNLWESLKK